MVGVGVESPAPPAARRLRPGRVSAKRSWPPGCGRLPPAPPPEPAPAAAAGDGENGVDGGAGVLGGRAGEAIAPAAVSPPAQNGSLLRRQGSGDKGEEAVGPAAVSPVAQNGALPRQPGMDKMEEAAAPTAASTVTQNGDMPPQQGSDKVEEEAAPAAVSPVVQNGGLPQQQGSDKVEEAAALAVAQNGAHHQQVQNKVEELVVPAAALPAACNGSRSHVMPKLGPEGAGEDGDKGENGALQLLGDEGVLSLDVQEGSRVLEVAAQPVKVLESCGIVSAASSVQNRGEDVVFLALKEQEDGGSAKVGREEVAADGDAMEMGNRTGGCDLETKENGVAGSRAKRWLTSVVNPPPKNRVVSAVRRFPPGCGRTTVTTKGSGVLEASPVRTFPSSCGRAAVTTTDSRVLEVSPIRTFPPGCGRSAVTITDSGDQEGLPLEATHVSSSDAMVAVPVLGGAAASTLAQEASNEKMEGKRMVDEGHGWTHDRVQILDDFVGTEQDGDLQLNVVAKATLKNNSNEKMKGTHSPREGKHVARVVVDDKMKNKLEGSFNRSTLRTPLSDPVAAKTKRKSLESDETTVALLCDAKASMAEKMQSKILSTKKEVTCSNVNMRQNKVARKLKGDGIGKDNLYRSDRESKFGKQVGTSQSDGLKLVPDQLIVQALMAPDRCPWSRGRKSVARASKSLPRTNKLKGKDSTPRRLLMGKVPSSEAINDEIIEQNNNSNLKDDDNSKALVMYGEKQQMEDNDNSNMEDDDNSKALVVYGEKREICVTVPPSVPFGSHHMQLGDHDMDARSKVRKLLQLFQAICRKLMQAEEQGIRSIARIDLEAMNALKKDPIYRKLGAIVGNVPGVEIGDEFHFRVELSMVGLHRPNQAGIDTSKVNGVLVATSIVASGGYPDELSSSDELIYTGSGGKAGGNKDADDQKLERGNLALKNCIETKTPVRVIHGFKGQSKSKFGPSRAKQTSTFIYDGLYEVVECWKEGPKGEMVFKYKLRRIAGQPELALHTVKATRKSKVREGLCLPDISQGSERIPICVINTIDDMRPAPFKYITKVIYPTWYEKEPPAGCDCTNGCSDSIRCACVVKNGGEIPFNFNGAIVEARPLIYECGPSCRCPPSCHNRVSQHGIKIPLEIFKTGKTGWGVRSLSSISSGSFICKYTGELLEDKEAEKTQNDEYLFDIGSNYHDEELWEGLKSVVGVQSSTSTSETMEGFTIDAAECGNVGRFINHSCSPNLYAQNVLWDHDDMRMPHVMFFAIENIPPLQELTYHYNYKVGEVHDKNGNEKVKNCYCGASDCCGRLY
ncbi:uncharacterized protein LOC120683361 [Panicum virgatum]|uniref:Uncharacterized protein n=1 Tax=Panicum virgatum TaxID=38727 RepID=A0A8T0PZS3_PANVG|nr:uncharacterized protein LOC120683361 [Panicum virgatum]KAG2568103.1 hypothetical protein PVAP13_7NG291800 [Panicum virgatum]KAG2568104.1 hypothetical protein PVAP13_7NG291800 [Panicum virgatum]KAG2568105.1 hypothetical protein PVAP13_7NG291800 [Panicum virgatum]KAG2568106.1 hypothetical protein PVAP13_7NG291800 [Panicum virgatum]KAG2568107.1 hypothetical protein PVAP13_7NG291800 [Panicum virgatum]